MSSPAPSSNTFGKYIFGGKQVHRFDRYPLPLGSNEQSSRSSSSPHFDRLQTFNIFFVQ